jgi:hypothetical protein
MKSLLDKGIENLQFVETQISHIINTMAFIKDGQNEKNTRI